MTRRCMQSASSRLNWTNGTLQPAGLTSRFLDGVNAEPKERMVKFPQERLEFTLRVLATRLRQNQSLASDTFTAIDIITVYPTTQR